MWRFPLLLLAFAEVAATSGGATGRRKLFIGGNWKANATLATALELVKTVVNRIQVDTSRVDVVIAPSFVHLQPLSSLLKAGFQLAAQTCSATGFGAYTGEVPIEMLRDIGVQWVILGHSERRIGYGETNEKVAAKVFRAQGFGLKVILCIGETRAERDSGQTFATLSSQLSSVKSSVADWQSLVIAYEPVWAVGTGQTASPADVESVHNFLRDWVATNVSPAAANEVRLIYGGSVSETTYKALIHLENVDGFLIGGAAVKPAFQGIVEGSEKELVRKEGTPRAHL